MFHSLALQSALLKCNRRASQRGRAMIERLLTEREREKQRESTKQEFRERERVVRVYFVGRVDG